MYVACVACVLYVLCMTLYIGMCMCVCCMCVVCVMYDIVHAYVSGSAKRAHFDRLHRLRYASKHVLV